jgi:hypothetical protein
LLTQIKLTDVEFGDGIEYIIGLSRWWFVVLDLHCLMLLQVNSKGCCACGRLASTRGSTSAVLRNLEEVLSLVSCSGTTVTNSCWW